jgi:tRNA A-37 threonylcarbamoyl transferase component Bud32/tetratricopeptide (TPR) repeat protein
VTAEQWRRARDLFDAALSLPPEERREFVRVRTAAEPELFSEVESLLEAHAASEGRYETGPAALIPREKPDQESGRRIGPWRLLREVGEGGAGIVYAAARDDEAYRKIVALKLMRPDRESREMVRRFKLERQVLASLDHPHIARLLDAGTADGGRAYLVMEFVEGVPIDQWIAARDATIEQKLRLFLRVADAVAYAHRNLVVHCDLKPANILVNAEGEPKLLDFGIAKLLRPEFSADLGVTRPFGRMLTPEYASPEQVRGQPVTVSVDIYALGVLLYRMLAGKAPYEFASASMIDIERAICQAEPKRPSAFDPRLKGDLDAIILTALAKDPHDRYPTVDRLAADIRNYLEGKPVSARDGGVLYRARKFVQRNRLAVTAAALAAIALAASAGVSIYYAKAAHRRLQQTNELARFVLFRFDDAIRSGQTNARRVLVSEGLEYLERLSAEAGAGHSLKRELAAAYVKMGDIQGNPFEQNLGDVRGARASFAKALALSRAVGDPQLAATAQIKLADLEAMGGDRHQGLRMYREALAGIERLPRSEASQKLLGETLLKMAWTQAQSGDPRGAQDVYERAVGIARRLYDGAPTDLEAKLLYARVLERAGLNQAEMGDSPGGVGRLSEASALMQQMAAGNPANAELARRAFACSVVLADVLKRSGREAEAEDLFRRMLAGAEARSRRDPSNVLFQRDRYVTMARLAELIENDPAKRAEARALTREALTLLRPIVAAPDAADYDLHQYAWILVRTPFADLRDPRAAVEYAQRAVERTNGTEPALLDLLAQAYAAAGDPARAVETERRSLALLPALDPGARKSALRVELETNLAKFEAQAARTRAAVR